jgi:hypothetical protein
MVRNAMISYGTVRLDMVKLRLGFCLLSIPIGTY